MIRVSYELPRSIIVLTWRRPTCQGDRHARDATEHRRGSNERVGPRMDTTADINPHDLTKDTSKGATHEDGRNEKSRGHCNPVRKN